MKRALLYLSLMVFSAAMARAQATSCNTQGATQIASGLTATNYTDTTVSSGANYGYVAVAENLAGISPCSNIVTGVLIPSAGAHSVLLTWTASATPGVTYAVFRAAAPSAPGNLSAIVN